MADHHSDLGHNLEHAAETAMLAAGIAVILGYVLPRLFAQRRAYGRTRAGAALLLLGCVAVQWAWVGPALAANPDPSNTTAYVLVCCLADLLTGLVSWLVLIRLINAYDRATGRQQHWLGHWLTLPEIAQARTTLAAQVAQARANLPLDVLLAAGEGIGGFFAGDLATLTSAQARWAELDQAEQAVIHGPGVWITDGPAPPAPLRTQLRRRRKGTAGRP